MSSSASFTPTLQYVVRELRVRLKEVYGSRLNDVVLYGSHARGDATETSDIDVMVVLDGEVDPWTELQRMSEPVYDLELETEEMITLYPISQTEFADREHPFLTNVRREGITV